MHDETPSLKTLLVRGWRKRCPRCGEGRLFRRFNILHKSCSVCGLQYLEDQGALFGYLFLIDRALFLFPLIGGLIHILLIIAVIAIIWHFIKGKPTTGV